MDRHNGVVNSSITASITAVTFERWGPTALIAVSLAPDGRATAGPHSPANSERRRTAPLSVCLLVRRAALIKRRLLVTRTRSRRRRISRTESSRRVNSRPSCNIFVAAIGKHVACLCLCVCVCVCVCVRLDLFGFLFYPLLAPPSRVPYVTRPRCCQTLIKNVLKKEEDLFSFLSPLSLGFLFPSLFSSVRACECVCVCGAVLCLALHDHLFPYLYSFLPYSDKN